MENRKVFLAFVANVLGPSWKKYKVQAPTFDEPKTWDQCMKRSDANLWIEAVLTERTTLLQHDVYEVVTAPP